MPLHVENYVDVISRARGYFSKYPVNAQIVDTGGQSFNVLAYAGGATINKGTVDATSAFNTALTAAAGNTLFIPAGTYSLQPGTLSNIPANTKIVGAGMNATILTVPNSFSVTNNLIQVVTVSNVEISDLMLDGNLAHTTGNQYGLFLSGATNCSIHDLQVQNWQGDGVQLYNSTSCMVERVFSTGNLFHGFEIEQCTGCSLIASRGYSNTVNGLFVTPGEVGSAGSHGNKVLGCTFDSNSNYGICTSQDNGGAGAQLNTGNIFSGNSVLSNAQYGVCFYVEGQNIFTNNYVFNNGYFGLYGFKSSDNIVEHNIFSQNSQASSGSYDEILFEGFTSGTASSHNNISHNTILIPTSTPKARYAINETSASDGPNVIVGNIVPNAGTSGRINSIATGDIVANNLQS